MPLEATRFGDLPAFAAASWGECEALRFGSATMTFAGLNEQIDRAAKALLARGIRRGDTVGFWLTNGIEFIVGLYAAMRIGAVAAPMNTRYREHDVAYTLQLSECKLLFVIGRSGQVAYLEMLKAVLPGFDGTGFHGAEGFPHLKDIVVINDESEDKGLSWERFLAGAEAVSAAELQEAADHVREDDVALIIFTSGTTGKPKAVMQEHRLLRNIRERHESWPLRNGDTSLTFLPMFHAFGMAEQLVGSMITGVRQIVMDSWDAERALDLIAEEGVNGLFGFETHYADMLRAQERAPRDLSSLKFGALPAGMANSNAVAAKVQKAMCPTVSGYGMSEIGCFVCASTLQDAEEQRSMTSGRPSRGLEVRIVQPDTGEDCPAGEAGEILCRGYTVMRGYFRDPEATAKIIDADGWLHTGDRGLLREDGFLQLIGRYKEMLKVGGENVSPAALEEELSVLVPSIEQVAVIGVPHDRLVEVAAAYVVPRPGQTCSLEDVQARCKGKIASFKIPHHVFSVDSLPMTASGKVQRTLLRERAIGELAAASACR
ncbi:MAG: class I adenylate-forming enzyme family protein [Sphingobium sp.]